MKYIYNGIVKKVIDGDTIDVVVDLGFSIYTNIRFRLFGIDTPEINSKDVGLRELALKAKTFMEETLIEKPITIDSMGKDKYGRYLGVISLSTSSPSINEQLIALGLARAYFGDGKTATVWGS